MTNTKRDVCRSGECVICHKDVSGVDSDILKIHHWFEPPTYRYQEALICNTCNSKAVAYNFWFVAEDIYGVQGFMGRRVLDYPRFEDVESNKFWHVLPSLDFQCDVLVNISRLWCVWDVLSYRFQPDAHNRASHPSDYVGFFSVPFGGKSYSCRSTVWDEFRTVPVRDYAVVLRARTAYFNAAVDYVQRLGTAYSRPLPNPPFDLYYFDPFNRGKKYMELYTAYWQAETSGSKHGCLVALTELLAYNRQHRYRFGGHFGYSEIPTSVKRRLTALSKTGRSSE